MLYLLILPLAVSLAEVASEGPVFMIKHKMSGKYIHPFKSNEWIPDDDHLVLYQGYQSHMYMTFDSIDDEWGYIRHIDSGKIFHPQGGGMTPSDQTNVVLYDDNKPWAYFALDQYNNHIVHHGGCC